MMQGSKNKNAGLVVLIFAVLASSANAQVDHLLSLSLEELLSTPVYSTSLFEQTYGESSYPVTIVKEDDWNRYGARNQRFLRYLL